MLLTCDKNPNGFSKLCNTLKRLGVKETSCTHIACLLAVIRCKSLEVLNFSHTAVVKEFFQKVKHLDQTSELKTLFLPVTNGGSFQDVIKVFPNLEDLRIWTAVPQLK